MDFSDFPRFTDTDDPDEAVKQIEALRNVPKDWMNETPEQTKLEDFQVSSDKSRYTVEVDDVPFECLYFPSEHRRLYVMLSAGRGAGVYNYPIFMRWKFSPFFKGHVLCIDDPMYHFHPTTYHANWFYGTPDKSYLVFLLSVVKKFMEQLSVKAEDVTFIGSSAGGYAAIYLANLLDYSAAIAMNPQFLPCQWQVELITPDFVKWGIDLGDFDDPFGRNKLKITNPKSRFLISVNYMSDADFRVQLGSFLEDYPDYKPKFGLSKYKNITIWLMSANQHNNHNVWPNEVGTVFADYVLQQEKKGYDTNELTAVSQIFNEITKERCLLSEKAEMYRKSGSFVVKANLNNYHQVDDNLILQHNSGNIHFEFDRNIFDEHIIKNKTMITTFLDRPPISRYAVIPLVSKLQKNKAYILKMRFKVVTDNKDYNFHIKQSLSGKYQLIYCHRMDGNSNEKMVEKEIEFIPSADVYDEFMIGAAQLRGEDAYLLFDRISIIEKEE